MVDSLVLGERRRALRVPAHGVALMYANGGPQRGLLENISHLGALLSVAVRPLDAELDLELRLANGAGFASVRTMRVEPDGRGWRIAVAFERVDDSLRVAIDAAIRAARGAARERPVLVIDENLDRKRDLVTRLSIEGMTPLVPRTPLEAIDILTRSPMHSGLLLLAPGFGVPSTDLRQALTDSFPWLSVAEITDDLEETTHQAIDTWNLTPIARIPEPA